MEIENAWYRISAKALIYNAEWKVLLCREESGLWDFPGGWLDHGEYVETCIKRELYEEMGLKVMHICSTPKVFVTAHKPKSTSRPWISNICYEVQVQDFEFTPSDECVEIWFFSPQEILELDTIVNAQVIAKELMKI